jgi:hypothetical protein
MLMLLMQLLNWVVVSMLCTDPCTCAFDVLEKLCACQSSLVCCLISPCLLSDRLSSVVCCLLSAVCCLLSDRLSSAVWRRVRTAHAAEGRFAAA